MSSRQKHSKKAETINKKVKILLFKIQKANQEDRKSDMDDLIYELNSYLDFGDNRDYLDDYTKTKFAEIISKAYDYRPSIDRKSVV